MNIPLLDLTLQYAQIKEEVDCAVMDVIRSQKFILGPVVEQFEKAAASYCGVRFAVGLSSGTDALLAALMALGIGPGDEVITSPFTFFATAGCIARVGAKPVFVDIEPDTFNIAPNQIEAAITRRTKAIIPVHLFGQCADMKPILEVARAHNLWVIEDAAQAIGAEYQPSAATTPRRAGTMGEIGCFSFFPSKNLGAFGDGGMATTNDEALYDRLKMLRMHGEGHFGKGRRYHHAIIGANFRLDAIQAAVLMVKLKYLDIWTEKRRENAARYDRLFAEAKLVREDRIILPTVRPGRHIFNQYTIRAKARDSLREHLERNGIGCAIYYPIPLHLQECFASLGYKVGDFPESERAAEEVLSLPIFPELTPQQQEHVVHTIAKFYRA